MHVRQHLDALADVWQSRRSMVRDSQEVADAVGVDDAVGEGLGIQRAGDVMVHGRQCATVRRSFQNQRWEITAIPSSSGLHVYNETRSEFLRRTRRSAIYRSG